MHVPTNAATDIRWNPDLGDRLVTAEEVSAKLGISIATIYRRIKAGKFPSRVLIGERNVRWWLSEVEAWGRGLRTLDSPPTSTATH